jgi:hypothetical protein
MFTAIRAETAHSPTYQLLRGELKKQKEGRAVTGIWESSYCLLPAVAPPRGIVRPKTENRKFRVDMHTQHTAARL